MYKTKELLAAVYSLYKYSSYHEVPLKVRMLCASVMGDKWHVGFFTKPGHLPLRKVIYIVKREYHE